MESSRFPCKRLLRMPGSTTTRGRRVSCDIDTSRVAFCGTENISTPNLSYAAQYLACALPCERFTSALADNPCITRGQCGSLLLHRDGLPPSTSCRSPGAPVHTAGVGVQGVKLRAMEYRYVEETDQSCQPLLEIYCAVVLVTPYNDFGTH